MEDFEEEVEKRNEVDVGDNKKERKEKDWYRGSVKKRKKMKFWYMM